MVCAARLVHINEIVQGASLSSSAHETLQNPGGGKSSVWFRVVVAVRRPDSVCLYVCGRGGPWINRARTPLLCVNAYSAGLGMDTELSGWL